MYSTGEKKQTHTTYATNKRREMKLYHLFGNSVYFYLVFSELFKRMCPY